MKRITKSTSILKGKSALEAASPVKPVEEIPGLASPAFIANEFDLPVAGIPPKKGKPARKRRSESETDNNQSILNWYLNEIHRIPMLTREEEMDVARRAQAGNIEARDRLVRANLRFVVTVARKYQSYGLTLMDLINEGNLGLIKAAERFNPERGFHFISYAVWWIKQAILFAIQQKAHLIRLPLNRTADLRRLEEAERWIENQDDVEYSLDNLASALDMKTGDLNHLINMSRDHLSLDAPLGDGEDFSLAESIKDDTVEKPELRLEEEQLKKDIYESLSGLTSREKNVLTMRFGLGGTPVMSLQKIGKKIGLSKERIRQIEKKAIRKIRTGKNGQQLGAYL
ncbi:MAG: RNA polymerase sigma factor RpoD/SigA [Spirochaetia bacterium]|nr:RNA polymerase sigma factor RpoD/SigA [Spirochaetia bacterium]